VLAVRTEALGEETMHGHDAIEATDNLAAPGTQYS